MAKPSHKSDNIVIYQLPNVPIILALAGLTIAWLTTAGIISDVAFTIGILSLGIWSWLEVTEGHNWIRRLLGIYGAVVAIILLFIRLQI